MNGAGSPSVVSVSRDSAHHFGKSTVDEISLTITGLRNPCSQIDGFQRGLVKAVLGHDDDDDDDDVVRQGGVMSVVLSAGRIRPGDTIEVIAPVGAPIPLQTA